MLPTSSHSINIPETAFDIRVMNRLHCKYSRMFGNLGDFNAYLQQMKTLQLNRGYRLPICAYSSMAIDVTDGRFMLAGCSDGDVCVTDLVLSKEQQPDAFGWYRRRPLTDDGHKGRVLQCTWFPKDASSFLTASRDHCIKLWDTSNFMVIDTYNISAEQNSITSIDWNDCDPYLIAVATSSPCVNLFDPAVGLSVQHVRWQNKHLNVVRWVPNSMHYLVAGTQEGDLGVFDVRQARKPAAIFDTESYQKRLHKPAIAEIRITNDANRVVHIDVGGKLRSHNMTDGSVINCYPKLRGHAQGARNFCISNEHGRLLAFVGVANTVNIIDMDQKMPDVWDCGRDWYKQCVTALPPAFTGNVLCCAYRPRYNHIVAYSSDRSCSVYTPKTEIRAELDRPVNTALHEDNWSSDDDM